MLSQLEKQFLQSDLVQMQADFANKVEVEFSKMIESVTNEN